VDGCGSRRMMHRARMLRRAFPFLIVITALAGAWLTWPRSDSATQKAIAPPSTSTAAMSPVLEQPTATSLPSQTAVSVIPTPPHSRPAISLLPPVSVPVISRPITPTTTTSVGLPVSPPGAPTPVATSVAPAPFNDSAYAFTAYQDARTSLAFSAINPLRWLPEQCASWDLGRFGSAAIASTADRDLQSILIAMRDRDVRVVLECAAGRWTPGDLHVYLRSGSSDWMNRIFNVIRDRYRINLGKWDGSNSEILTSSYFVSPGGAPLAPNVVNVRVDSCKVDTTFSEYADPSTAVAFSYTLEGGWRWSSSGGTRPSTGTSETHTVYVQVAGDPRTNPVNIDLGSVRIALWGQYDTTQSALPLGQLRLDAATCR
jgi:hypothetical protein